MELVKMKIGVSLFYYIYLFACIGVFIGLYFGLRKKSKKVQNRVLLGILIFNFVLHFVKLAFPEYINKGFPQIIRKCTPENICAVSTLIFPFIYLSDWKAGKDYMFYLGTISGLLGCFAPMPVVGLPFYSLETIRCYICHASLWQVPILMVVFGIHKLDYRRNWKALLVYFGILCIIMVNELIMIRIGWVGTDTLEDFFDASERDMGYAVGFPPSMQKIAVFLLWLTPKAWKEPCVPILWELFPVLILGGLYTLAICAYWEHDHMKSDFIAVKNKIKGFIQSRKRINEGAGGDKDAVDENAMTDEVALDERAADDMAAADDGQKVGDNTGESEDIK